eukprot:328052-Chlamydomonas_euryale.AAC.1
MARSQPDATTMRYAAADSAGPSSARSDPENPGPGPNPVAGAMRSDRREDVLCTYASVWLGCVG